MVKLATIAKLAKLAKTREQKRKRASKRPPRANAKMRQKIEGIVLGIVRHNENTDVATLYTREMGRVGVAVPAAKRMRRGGNAPLMPLSVIEGEVSRRQGSDLLRMWRFATVEGWSALRNDPMKVAVGMFVCEFLNRLLREQAPDAPLWRGGVNMLRLLDGEHNPVRVANFHLVLLWQMLYPAGIVPDLSSRRRGETQWLDMRRGIYVGVRPSHSDVVAPQWADVPPLLARLTFRNSHRLRLTGDDRYLICEALLHYYAVHLPGLGALKSHHVLRTLF